MKLTGNQIMYLLTIKSIGAQKHVIRSVDVADELDYSRASIHKMLITLKGMNLIKHDYYSAIQLTPLGSRTANAYQKKYEAVKEALDGVIDLPEGYCLGVCELLELM